MIVSLALILLCQLVGEIVARWTQLPLPSPVIGLVLLFAIFLVRDRIAWLPPEIRGEPLEVNCETLLQHMAMMFVPAGVGVVQRLDILARYGVGVVATVILTTAFSIAVTAVTFEWVARWFPAGPEGAE